MKAEMAERRINRRLQSTQFKAYHDDNLDIAEEGDEEEVEDKRKVNQAFVSKSKDATVEVTVKVKKRRDKSGDSGKKSIPIRDKEFRKGSWGDLLSASRTSLVAAGKDTKTDKRKLETGNHNRRSSGGDGDRKCTKKKDDQDHSPLCQKIPITDDLYLETHTHIRKSHSADTDVKSGNKSRTPAAARHRSLMRENEDLRDQVDRLLREIEVTRGRPRPMRSVSRSSPAQDQDQYTENTYKKSKASTQCTQTSTANLAISPKKKSGQVDVDVVDSRSPQKKSSATATVSTSSTTAPPMSSESAAAQLENLRLEKENEALRVEAAKLVGDMNRARTEYLECCTTMKELHNIAEILKRDNFHLLQKHQQQQTLESKLIQAMAENREMKEVLESIVDKQKSSRGIQDDQLSQIRNVIKDVKSTIAQEMQGLVFKPPANSSFLVEKDDNGDSDIGFRIGESFLNDTNASEIQRILGEPPEIRRGNSQEDRSSSTQYYAVGGLSGLDSNYRPSPLAVTKFSPRVSTPNSSSISLSPSETGDGFLPVQPISRNQSKPKEDNEWKRLEQEVARSFLPVRNELSHCSTSSYSSTSSSPNPR